MTANDNLPLPLSQAADALGEGRVEAAERLLRPFLAQHPDDPNALMMLAEVAIRCECFGDAEGLLERCLDTAPDYRAARFRYAALSFQLNKAHRAIAEADALLAEAPESFEFRNLKAAALARIGETGAALALHEELLRDHPERPAAWLNYAADLKSAGRQSEAIALYRQALEKFPGLVEAWWSLGNLKTFRFDEDDLAAMQAKLAAPDTTERDCALLHFTLGKAAEDARDYAPSFDHYAKANALQRKAVRYDADRNAAFFDSLIRTFTPEFFARHAGSGASARDPIFIVGLARSGSTLIEQMLSSHSTIEATMELPNITHILDRLDGPYPEILNELEPEIFEALGDEYIDDTRAFRRTERPYFIDKMPENFRHIGLIHLILPGAKIVDARRHPLSTGLSLFRQDFETDYAYSYDQGDIGRYYSDYVRLMAHWDAVLPGRIHRVFHEDMVADPEATLRRLLDYLGLPFEEQCLRFHETARTIRTASSEQVRQPIFTDALEQWRNYERWLDPMKDALGPVLAEYPKVPDFTALPGNR
ncbi:MAG TPA: sulfotransferase [Rhizomicrobium sp.]|nr:sulfotransferase [Rhizomicrobium sp.]